MLAVAILSLATFALAPVLMGGGAIDYNDFFSLILFATIAAVSGFGFLAVGFAEPTKAWLIPLGITATWCLVIGLLTLFTNYSGRSYWAGNLQEAEVRSEQLRGPGIADSKGEAFPAEYVRKQLDDAEADIRHAQESRDYKQSGVYLSLGMLLVGLLSAAKFALLFRQRSRAS
jgi:hypothetical protein